MTSEDKDSEGVMAVGRTNRRKKKTSFVSSGEDEEESSFTKKKRKVLEKERHDSLGGAAASDGKQNERDFKRFLKVSPSNDDEEKRLRQKLSSSIGHPLPPTSDVISSMWRRLLPEYSKELFLDD